MRLAKEWLMVAMVVLAAGTGCSRQEHGQEQDAGGPPPGSDVVARVNGVAISKQDYQSALRQAELDLGPAGGAIGESEKVRLGERILHKLIQDELLVQYARDQELSVSREELDARFDDIKRRGGGDEAMAAYVARSGLDPKRIRANLERNMLIERLAEKIRAEQKVDPKEIADYYQAHQQEFSQAGEVDLAHILFKAGAKGGDPEARARWVRAEIARGLSFAAAARKYSDDPATREQGGKLGTLKQGEMIAAMEKAVFSTPVGQVSQPVLSPAGVHLLKVEAVRPGKTPALQDIRQQVLARVLDSRVQREMARLAESLAGKARVETGRR